MKILTPEQALAKLQDLCARAEVSTGEALEKLRRWGVTGHRAEQVVQSLVDSRFIDDGRFARAFVRDRYLYSRWGRLKISQALRLKRVDREYIDEALDEEIDQQVYEANLVALLRAKLRQLPDSDDEYAICGKLMRFAAGRGFEPSLIMRVVESGALGDDSDVAPTD